MADAGALLPVVDDNQAVRAALDMIELLSVELFSVELVSVELVSVDRVAQGWSALHVGIATGS